MESTLKMHRKWLPLPNWVPSSQNDWDSTLDSAGQEHFSLKVLPGVATPPAKKSG